MTYRWAEVLNRYQRWEVGIHSLIYWLYYGQADRSVIANANIKKNAIHFSICNEI